MHTHVYEDDQRPPPMTSARSLGLLRGAGQQTVEGLVIQTSLDELFFGKHTVRVHIHFGEYVARSFRWVLRHGSRLIRHQVYSLAEKRRQDLYTHKAMAADWSVIKYIAWKRKGHRIHIHIRPWQQTDPSSRI